MSAWRGVLLCFGAVVFVSGLFLLGRPADGKQLWEAVIGIRQTGTIQHCYQLKLAHPPKVHLDEQFLVTGEVTAIRWGVRHRPNLQLQLSGAGMQIDPSTPIESQPSGSAELKRLIRWSVKPNTAGRYRMVLNTGSSTHPLQLIDTDGVLTIDVTAGWLPMVSRYLGWILAFLGPLATLPGLLQLIESRKAKRATVTPVSP